MTWPESQTNHTTAVPACRNISPHSHRKARCFRHSGQCLLRLDPYVLSSDSRRDLKIILRFATKFGDQSAITDAEMRLRCQCDLSSRTLTWLESIDRRYIPCLLYVVPSRDTSAVHYSETCFQP